MPKKREKNDKEYYQGIIRELKAELKRLKQQVKRLERREHHHETVKDEPEDDVQYDNYEEICPDCHKGKLVEHIVAGRYWVSCDCCNYRTKATKIGDK
jgi:hypothetical protein